MSGSSNVVTVLASGFLVVVALALPTGQVRADVPGDPVLDPAGFREPPASVRPKARWWWGAPLEPNRLKEEFNAMADAGFGGAEVAFFGSWADEPQRAGVAAALEVANARGLALDMTLGKAWPVSTPNTGGDVKSPDHAQEMMYGAVSVTGPGAYNGPPPPPQDANVHAGVTGAFQTSVGVPEARLLSVSAAFVAEEGTPVVFMPPDAPYVPLAPTAPAKSIVLDPASVVDLTSTIDSSGNVHFTPSKPGRWIVFALWQRPAIQNVMNHLRAESAATVAAYVDQHQIGAASIKALRPGSHFFEDSLELNFNGVPWTDGFLEEFKRRRGYDLAPFAPAVFIADEYNVPGHDPREMPNADYEFADGIGQRVRNDFWRTLTELYSDAHIARFHAYAKRHRMEFRTQPYGSIFDPSTLGRDLAKIGAGIDVESLGAGDPSTPGTSQARSSQDTYRVMVSGSDQGGGEEVSSELGASVLRNYKTSLSEYKALMDKEWAAGVTTPIIHGYAYQPPDAPWPSHDYMFGAIAQMNNHRTFPEWGMWRRLADYWARGSWVLRSGQPIVDMVVYKDMPFAGGPERFDGKGVEQAGYTYGYVDPSGLEEPAADGKGVLFPNGPSYRVIVIDQDSMRGSAAQALARHVARGLAVVIVGDAPTHGSGNRDPEREDAQVVTAFKKILASPRTRVVATQAETLEALRRLGVDPGVRFSRPTTVLSRRRQTTKTDYWYLWNGGTESVSVSASFATNGFPKTLDLWSGAIEPVAPYTTSGGRVEIPLTLAAGETRVIAFDRTRSAEQALHVLDSDAEAVSLNGRDVELRDTTGGGTRFVALSNGDERLLELPQLPGPISPASWKLHVKKSQASPDGSELDVELTTLEDWRNIPGLEEASGTGTYTTTVDVPTEWTARDRGAELDLGTIWGSVQVFVNGQLATPAATTHTQFDVSWLKGPPTMDRIDVSRLLRPGANEIRVVLSTTLVNAAAAHAKSGTNPALAVAAASGTQPYGLKGPVRLQPVARASFTTRAARSCTSRRRMTVHLRAPRKFRAARTVVVINGKRSRAHAKRSGRRLAVRVDLRRLPAGRVKVRVTIRPKRGRSLRTVRTYRLCAPQ